MSTKKLNADIKRAEIIKLLPEEIYVPQEGQGRAFDVPEPKIKELAESIKRHGQLEPIGVRKGDGNKPTVIYGFTRLRALLYINLNGGIDGEPLRITAQLHDCNAEEAFLLNIEENLRRNEVSPIDTAHNVRKLSAEPFNLTQAAIGKLYGKSAAWVAQHNDLLTLSGKVQKKIHAGDLPLATALLLAQVPEAERESILALAEELTGGKATRSAIRQAAKSKDAAADGDVDGEGSEEGKEGKPAKESKAAALGKPSYKDVKELMLVYSSVIPEFGILLDWAKGAIADNVLDKKMKKYIEERGGTVPAAESKESKKPNK